MCYNYVKAIIAYKKLSKETIYKMTLHKCDSCGSTVIPGMDYCIGCGLRIKWPENNTRTVNIENDTKMGSPHDTEEKKHAQRNLLMRA